MGKTATTEKMKPLRLDFRSEQTVVVVPEDEDRFVTTSRDAAHACRRAADEHEWRSEFHRFLTELNAWCQAHSRRIDRGYLGFGDEGLKVFLVTKQPEYDFTLDDGVSQLGVELDTQFPGCPADVMHVPDKPLKDLYSFFSPSKALQFYGR